MLNSRKIALAVVLLVAGLLAFLLLRPSDSFNWEVTYNAESKEPYGLFMTTTLLKSYFPDSKFKMLSSSPMEELKAKREDPAVYFFVGENFPNDSSLVNQLLAFADSGNTVFISCKFASSALLDKIFADTCLDAGAKFDSKYRKNVALEVADYSAEDARLSMQFYFKDKVFEQSWAYMPENFFCGSNENIEVLGTLDTNDVNFVCRYHGDGRIFLHSTPLALTNFFMDSISGFRYSSALFTYLDPGDILWDEYSKYYPTQSSSEPMHSPFSFILSEPSLRAAWYLSIALLLLYLGFYGKRRQSVIPVIARKKNDAMRYINTVGDLYWRHAGHKEICLTKRKQWNAYIRLRYGVDFTQPDDDKIRLLVDRSLIDEKHIRAMITVNQWINDRMEISDELLLEWHNLTEYFYKNCK
jgi:hypothetical protein